MGKNKFNYSIDWKYLKTISFWIQFVFTVFLAPICISAIVGVLTYKYTTSFSKALFFGITTAVISESVLYIAYTATQAYWKDSNGHDECKKRFEKIITSHALYTDNGYFEKVLSSIGQRDSKIKFSIAKMVSEALSKAFDSDNRFSISAQKYTNFAKIFRNCLVDCDKVVLTCIYSPSQWFKNLKNTDGYEWKTLPEVNLDEIFKNYAERETLKGLSDNAGQTNRYPAHFISHLQIKEPVRIFLLEGDDNNGEWKELITNKVAYQKIMIPSYRYKVKTIFVNLKKFQQEIFTKDNNPIYANKKLIEMRDNDKFKELDLNIFVGDENIALMRWYENEEKTEFLFDQDDEHLIAYKKLVDFIDSKSDDSDAEDCGFYLARALENKYKNLKLQ
jgi:hypothetical protein